MNKEVTSEQSSATSFDWDFTSFDVEETEHIHYETVYPPDGINPFEELMKAGKQSE